MLLVHALPRWSLIFEKVDLGNTSSLLPHSLEQMQVLHDSRGRRELPPARIQQQSHEVDGVSEGPGQNVQHGSEDNVDVEPVDEDVRLQYIDIVSGF